MSDVPQIVVKLGGSLLDSAEWVPRLRRWRNEQGDCDMVMLVGGGRFADVLRAVDREHPLRVTSSHRLCIELMAINAHIVRELLPEAVPVERLHQLVPREAGRLSLLDPRPLTAEDDPQQSSEPLPASWDVTSDSIAARLAELLGADELVLLKSVLPQSAATVQQAALAGYVDRFFPQSAARLPQVTCVNLRDADLPRVDLETE